MTFNLPKIKAQTRRQVIEKKSTLKSMTLFLNRISNKFLTMIFKKRNSLLIT